MVQVLKKAVYKHGYIFIAAAWLYTISFLFTNYFSYSSSPIKVAGVLSTYIIKQQQRFEDLVNDTSAVNGILSNQPTDVKQSLQNNVLGIYAFRINSMGTPIEIYWNNNTMSVGQADAFKPDGHYFTTYKNGSFDFVRRTVTYKGGKYIMACLIPIRWNYFFNNKYFEPWFQNYPELAAKYDISNDAKGAEVYYAKKAVLFRIKAKPNVNNDQPGTFSTLLRVLAVILLIVFINSIATDIVGVSGFYKTFLLLAALVLLLRYLTYHFSVPFNFRQLKLFTIISGNGMINQSLGDLLINSVLFYWITSFIKFNRPKIFKKGMVPNNRVMIFMSVVSLCFLLFILYFFTDAIISLVGNSQVQFEVTNFFTIDISIIVSFIIICLLFLSFFYLSHLLIKPLFRARISLNYKLLIMVCMGLVFISIRSFSKPAGISLLILVWFVLYIFMLERRKTDAATNIIESPFFLFWAIFFMLSATALISYQMKEIEFHQRKTLAEKYAFKTNEDAAQILGLSVTSLDTAALSNNFWRFYNRDLNKNIKDSLVSTWLEDYQEQYTTHIYTYDATSQHSGLFNEDSLQYTVIKSIVQTQAKKTNSPGLYYYENSPEAFSYIYFMEVDDDKGGNVGSIFIVVDPRRYDRDILFSPLLRIVKNLSNDDNTNYSTAIYKRGRLVKTSNNDFDFSDTISSAEMPKFTDTLINKKGYSQYWYNAGSDKIIVVVKKSDWLLNAFTIFSYLFCLFIALVIFLHYNNLLFKTGFRLGNLRRFFSFNIRTQIQATVIAVSLFSFIIIGIITISFFVVSFNKDTVDKLTTRANVVKNEIEGVEKKHDYQDGSGNHFTNTFKRELNEISAMQQADFNLYDPQGNLINSSQDYIFSNQILSNKMQPEAYKALHYDHKIQHVQDEQIGNISYVSIYIAVRDAKNNVIAYLNLPSLNSQNELKEEINNFLVTLININALIFIFAGGIAILVTSRITSSFTLIGNKMKEISFGRINEEITWTSNDEIGTLVNEYNKMVRKLEQSAQALARSEREGAWREMARQVAHEIKNPLTPMKLSIQYLQRAVNNNAPNVKELSQQVANTLIEQIEQLSKIAGDFSQFANIGNVAMENFEVSEVLASLINLYSADSNLLITWHKEEAPCIIKADKVQINRLFTNLIKNGIEASGDKEVIEITIRQYIKGHNVVIAIGDKGSGIPQEMRQKIFIPNFTTKSSGTGLGLAICHGIVEKASGAIWFETENGKGTTFYVSLPRVTEG